MMRSSAAAHQPNLSYGDLAVTNLALKRIVVRHYGWYCFFLHLLSWASWVQKGVRTIAYRLAQKDE